MKTILLFVSLLLVVSAARKEKKTTLEDVERGYITTKARLSPPPPPTSTKVRSKSPTQFGYIPVKTPANYVQKEPKITYAPPQYISLNQGKIKYQTEPQYSTIQYASGSQYTTGPVYTGPVYTGAGQGTPQRGVQKAPVDQTQEYYVPQQEQSQYLNYDNVQYVADNNIDQGAGQQHYNPQQYYYLQQQYQAPTTSIQAVVDPKGGLQYIMYIPTYVSNQGSQQQSTDQTQNYENVVYSDNDQTYQQPQSSPQYTTYTEKQPTLETGKSAYNVKATDFTFKREPKSLLDSYVPSVLQLQYYKQAQLNSIRDSEKYESYINPTGAESSYRYNYRPTPFRR
ncbi:uncharacterized protein LOC114349007 isoform X2 [Diabrotica virgifera virgifera]|nr:uncharacterized protein LOC114349007 isoform X2 [Diabrotica virgifera virgifera]